jgi:Arc/MetJ family transcription regulator
LCEAVCNIMYMATNLQIEDNLIQEALLLGGHRTKRAVVEEALREYVQRRKQLKILELFGTIEERDGKYLRVVLLEDRETVHNAFFDRSFKEVGK